MKSKANHFAFEKLSASVSSTHSPQYTATKIVEDDSSQMQIDDEHEEAIRTSPTILETVDD